MEFEAFLGPENGNLGHFRPKVIEVEALKTLFYLSNITYMCTDRLNCERSRALAFQPVIGKRVLVSAREQSLFSH